MSEDGWIDGEYEWMRGLLSQQATFRLMVRGPIGPQEITALIKILTLQRDILAEEPTTEVVHVELEPGRYIATERMIKRGSEHDAPR